MDTPIANDGRRRAVEEIFSVAETRSCPPTDAWRGPGIGGPRVERDGGAAFRVAGSRFAWRWVGLEGSRRDRRDDEISRLKGKAGEMTMENELLREKIRRMESGFPLARRKSKR